jgi:hypothetical protein
MTNNEMSEIEKSEMVSERIACPEAGYPCCEAKFLDTKEWEEVTGLSWEAHMKGIIHG